MQSIKELYKIGPGPSSSHTIGPANACSDFISLNNDFDRIEVVLYGSLALTGKGHFTDQIIKKILFKYNVDVIFNYSLKKLAYPNTMDIKGYKNNKLIRKETYYSIGGGAIIKKDSKVPKNKDIYKFKNFDAIKKYLKTNNISLVDLVNNIEDKDIDIYLENILNSMFNSIERNLKKTGYLPGRLKIKRVAKKIYLNAINSKNLEEKHNMLLTSFAYATSEGNASLDEVVTAPTCGSCGILPAILYYEYKYNKVSKKKLIDSLKVAGIFGNICKQNASISGAMLGCQAEVGVASCMASSALCYIKNLNIYQIEYAAEVSLEHFLGLTCDPVDGYVQIPCIERNGIGTLRAYSSYLYAKNIAPIRKNKVSFDDVVIAMKETGLSLNSDYKETSNGGLAKIMK